MGPIGPKQLELFALELGKIAAFHFVYSLASTNINQSAPNLVTMYMSIRSQMSLIMSQVIPDQSVLSALEIEKLVIPDQSVLSALEIEKLNFSSLFGIYSRTSEARTRESSNTTENSNKNLFPVKKCS